MADSHWSKVWQQLAVMLDAGLPLEMALKTLRGVDAAHDKALTRVIHSVKCGIALSDALHKTKLIDRVDHVVLRVAEAAGKMPNGLHYIAKRNLAWQQRIDRLQSSLWLPKGLLLVGTLSGLLIRMFAANQSVSVAIAAILPVVFITLALIMLPVWLLKKESLMWLSFGWRFSLVRRYVRIYHLLFEQKFYRLLIWQIEAGVVIDKALLNMSDMLVADKYKHNLLSSVAAVSCGGDLVGNLYEHGFVLTKELRRVLQTSSEAGALEQAVNQHIKWQQQITNDYAEQLIKWLPKVCYLIVLLAISRMLIV